MQVSKKFIEVYNETFKFIDENGLNVEDYWKRIGPIVLSDLLEKVMTKGLVGADEYWSETLCAEGAEFETYQSPNCLELEIDKCPSISHLSNPYHNYCGHCDVMYRQLFETLGYTYKVEKTGDGSCHITVSR